MLEYLNKLYTEELIQENIFTIETDQSFAMGTEGLYGSVVIANPETVYGDMGENFVGMPALEGPNGDKLVTRIGSTLSRMGEFVVTKENEYPATMLRWMDYFYSDDGAKLFFMGVEGETFEELEDGDIDYVESIKNSPDGLTLEQELSKYITWLGGGYPGIVKEEFFKGSSSLPSGLEAAERVKADIGEEVWPPFLYTEDESKEMSSLAADIEKYVDEMRDKFINGSESFSKWDDYIKTIENMGLDHYIEIQQAAYGRFKNN